MYANIRRKLKVTFHFASREWCKYISKFKIGSQMNKLLLSACVFAITIRSNWQPASASCMYFMRSLYVYDNYLHTNDAMMLCVCAVLCCNSNIFIPQYTWRRDPCINFVFTSQVFYLAGDCFHLKTILITELIFNLSSTPLSSCFSTLFSFVMKRFLDNIMSYFCFVYFSLIKYHV